MSRYSGATLAIRDRAEQAAATLWDASGSWNEPDIERIALRVASVGEAAQHQMGTVTEEYMRIVGRINGVATEPGSVDVTSQALRGVSSEELYERTGPTVWGELGAGKPLAEASLAGRTRLLQQLATNIQLAKTHTAQSAMRRQGGKARFYRRVLNGNVNCFLCVVASTQRYRRGDLLPIHPACDCSVMPIYGADPGLLINKERLDAAHATIEAHFGATDGGARGFIRDPEGQLLKFRDVLIVQNHGEIGPTLAVKHHKFYKPLDRRA